jgi:hypothetical protein
MQALKNSISIKDTMQVFGVSHMALYLWRQGTPTKTALPTVEIEGSREVRFAPPVLKRWAKENDVAILVDPSTFVGGKATKPGPKTTKVAAKKATKAKVKAPAKAARKRTARTH